MGRHGEAGRDAVALCSVGEPGSPRGVHCERRPYAHVVRELRARWISGRLPGWLKRVVGIGALPADSEELRVRKAVLVLSSTLMASLSCVWVVTYAVLGLWVSAAIPLVYQLASAASIYTFARTRRYLLFRQSQLWMSLVLPFVLPWSLAALGTPRLCACGGSLPLGALLFVGARQAVSWFVAFVGLVGGPGDRSHAGRRRTPHPQRRRDQLFRAEYRRRGEHRVRSAVLRTGARARAGEVRAPAAERSARAGGRPAQAGGRDHRRRPRGGDRAVRRHRRLHQSL